MTELSKRLEVAMFTPALHRMSSGFHRYHVGENQLTGEVIRKGLAAVLRELAGYQRKLERDARENAPAHAPDEYLAGYLDALSDVATGTATIANEIETTPPLGGGFR